MTQLLKLLIVGGYGVFGGRIVELLEGDARLTLLVGGRSRDKAEAFCSTRSGAMAKLVPLAFDRNGDIGAQLAAERPDLVIDASGPFQAYGEGRYRLIEACIAQGVDYLDLADGSEFVAGVRAFDAAARAAGVFVLSGVSSFPVLTAAVVRRLATGMTRLDTITGGIAPSPYAGVGENVIRAIAGYAGQRIELRRDGGTAFACPLTEQRRFTIAPPGRVPVASTLFSLVDVPDLKALPELWPDVKSVWMGAGPVPEILHRALIGFAWLVRLRLLPSLLPLAGIIHFVSNRLRWGEHRGGMFVQVEGVGEGGQPLRRSWHLLAEGDDGPLIPSMAVQGIVRRSLDGRRPAPGARAAVHDLELDDYEKLFAGRALYTGIREGTPPKAQCLYAALLGSAWNELSPAIRNMHDGSGTEEVAGRASVTRGGNPLARLAGWIMGFPQESADVPVTVRFERLDGQETWIRTFGKQRFASRQSAGRGRSRHLLVERFGPLRFAMALIPEDGKLRLVLRRWSLLRLPLPLWLAPRSNAFEASEDGQFRFHVEIRHPLTGLIVKYSGGLTEEAAPKAGELLPTT